MTVAEKISTLIATALTTCARALRMVDAEHGLGCGCPRLADSGGLYEPGKPAPAYRTEYPFFVCPSCWRLTPWCEGC